MNNWSKNELQIRIEDARDKFLGYVAYKIWTHGNKAAGFSESDLYEMVRYFLPRELGIAPENTVDFIVDLHSCPFFGPGIDGAYRYIETDFLYFFVAKWIKNRIMVNNLTDIRKHHIDPEVARFLSGMLENDSSFLEKIVASTRNLEYKDVGYIGGNALTLLNLAHASLKELDFSFTIIRGAILNGADLRDSNFRGADLCSVKLDSAWLDRADFRETNLSRCSIVERNEIGNLKFDPKGRFVATGDNFGFVKVWDTHTKSVQKVLSGHTQECWCVSWKNPNGEKIASGGNDGKLIIWNLLHEDSEIIEILDEIDGKVLGVDFHPTKPLLASVDSLGNIKIWNVENNSLVWQKKMDGEVYCVTWSPNGTFLACSYASTRIEVINSETWNSNTLPKFHKETVWNLAWTLDNRSLISGSQDNTVRLWELEECREIWCFNSFSSPIAFVSRSPDGKMIAASDFNGNIKVISLDGIELSSHKRHTQRVWSLSWSSDTGTLCSGGDDGRILLWTPPNRREPIGEIKQVPRAHGMKISGAIGTSKKTKNDLLKGGAIL